MRNVSPQKSMVKKIPPKKKAPAKKKAVVKKPKPPSGQYVTERREIAPTKKRPVRRKPSTTAIVKKDDSMLALDGYVKKRKGLIDFLRKQMREGIDYGLQFEGATKKSILIAGCEKVTTWLNLKPRYFPDQGSWTMLGCPGGVICLTTYLIWETNIPLIEKKIKLFGVENEEMVYRMYAETTGKGAASLKDKKVFDENVCLKKAKIRSTKDAVLALGLHDEFGQDYELYEEDIEKNHKDSEFQEPRRKKAKPKEEPKPEPTEERDSVASQAMSDEIIQLLGRSTFPEAQKDVLSKKAIELCVKNDPEGLKALKDSINRRIAFLNKEKK